MPELGNIARKGWRRVAEDMEDEDEDDDEDEEGDHRSGDDGSWYPGKYK